MDRMKEIISEKEKNFIQDSLQCSPKPQASSTFMISRSDITDSDDIKLNESKSKESNLVLSTTSSLGVIDINQESLFSECDSNQIQEWHQSFEQHLDVSEFQSQSLNQLKKRLDEISLKNSFSSEIFESIHEDWNNLGCDSTNNQCSLSNGEFQSGDLALMKIEQDQKENRNLYSSLPVSPINISENIEQMDEKEKQFSEYVKMRCHSPQEISDILRNKINFLHKTSDLDIPQSIFGSSQLMSQKSKVDQSEEWVCEKIVTSSTDCDLGKTFNILSKSELQLKYDEIQEKHEIDINDKSLLHSTNASCNQSSQSIASLNEIAEILKRQSLIAKPKLAVEKLLSIGKSRQKIEKTISTFSSNPLSTGDSPSEINASCETNETTLTNCNNKKITTNILPSSKIRANFSFAELSSNVKLPFNKNSVHCIWPYLIQLNALSEKEDDDQKSNTCSSSTAAEIVNQSNVSINRVNLTLSNSHHMSGYENDTIFAGRLCIGTLAEVIVIVENTSEEVFIYSVRLKSITSKENKKRAVDVMLVANVNKMEFIPNTETEVKVMLIPLVEGEIEIVLELVNEDKKCSNMLRKIIIQGERPNFEILLPSDDYIHFGTLHQNISKSVPIVVRNNGNVHLPLNFSIHDEDCDEGRNDLFHPNDQKMSFTRFNVIIEPHQTFRCSVCVDVACVENRIVTNSVNIRGKLVVSLDTPDMMSTISEDVVYVFPLLATLTKAVLFVDQQTPLIFKYDHQQLSSSNCTVVRHVIGVSNSSNRIVSVSVQIECFKNEFSCEPTNFKLLPNSSELLKITFHPVTTTKIRESCANIYSTDPEERVILKLIGIVENVSGSTGSIVLSKLPRNQSYKILSSCSSSSGSCITFDGMMELDSTHGALSWPSVPLHSRQIQSFTLRNRGSIKEKLLLLMSDARNVFNFVENEHYVKELKMSLDSKESRKVSVVFTPTIADTPMIGKITIVRRNTFESSIGDFQKRVIPMFGMGGNVKILFNHVFHDNEDRLWLTCDSNTMEAKFLIENTGNAEAFIKIVLDDLDDRISPEECTLLPSESIEINYALQLNNDRLEMLNKQHSHKEVMLVNKLFIYSGNESTRLRLNKIWFQCNESEKALKIKEKMEIINFESCNRIKIESLSDEKVVLTKFLYEGIAEHVIGVLIPRQNLENISLDSTVIFKDLLNYTYEPM